MKLEEKSSDSKIILALDYADKKDALHLVEQLEPNDCKLKIGKGMFTAFGPELVRQLVASHYSVFLDLKFHDIPQTVANAVNAAAELGVWMINIHLMGGREMIQAARKALDIFPEKERPLLIGVTLLTSLSELDLKTIGITLTIPEMVLRLAQIGYDCGLDGVVCSAQEVMMLKQRFGSDFLAVTPGIRVFNDDNNDQKRTTTPEEALKVGADYLVMGRSITHTDDPIKTLRKLNEILRQNA